MKILFPFRIWSFVLFLTFSFLAVEQSFADWSCVGENQDKLYISLQPTRAGYLVNAEHQTSSEVLSYVGRSDFIEAVSFLKLRSKKGDEVSLNVTKAFNHRDHCGRCIPSYPSELPKYYAKLITQDQVVYHFTCYNVL